MSRPKRRGIGRKMRRSVQGAGWVGGSQLCCLLPPANGWQPKSESGCRSDWSTVVVIFCLLHVAYQLFWSILPFLSLSSAKKILQFVFYLRTSWRPPFQRMKFVICKSPEPPDITCQQLVLWREEREFR